MRGLVVCEGHENSLRFLATDVFRVLEDRHQITYAIFDGPMLGEVKACPFNALRNRTVRWLPLWPGRFRRWQHLFNVSCGLARDQSKSFAVRWEQSLTQHGKSLTRLVNSLKAPGKFDKYRRRLEERMGVNPNLLATVLDEQPDFLLFPSSLLDNITDDVLQLASVFGIPTLMLVAGWDNLSSKGLVYHHPGRIGVWGEQTKAHAIRIQSIPADRVAVIGAPHFEEYFDQPFDNREALRCSFGLPASGSVVLFAGTFRQFDETKSLKLIDEAIVRGELPLCHILYRPQPQRLQRYREDNFFDYSWQHVTIDPQMAEAYHRAQSWGSDRFLDRLHHLPKVYRAVDAVISPMSTVLLEGLLFGRPALCVAFNDGEHTWSADKVSQMVHFQELYDIPEILVCRDQNRLVDDTRKLLAAIGNDELTARLRSHACFFVHRDSRPYADRVVDEVDRLLEVASAASYTSVSIRPGRRYRTEELLLWLWETKFCRFTRKVLRPLVRIALRRS